MTLHEKNNIIKIYWLDHLENVVIYILLDVSNVSISYDISKKHLMISKLLWKDNYVW